MKKKFTFLIAAYAALMLIFLPGTVKGQTKGYTKVYTLDGNTKGTGTTYNSGHDVTQDGITWNVTGNIEQTPWRIGGNKNNGASSNVDRPIYSKGTISDNVSRIVITHGTGNITVNSMILIVSTVQNGGGTVISSIEGTYSNNGTTTFDRPADKDWTGRYYKIVYNVVNNTTTNKYVAFSKAEFYKTTYSVTYNKNGNDVTGDVPTDNTSYSYNDAVTVLGNIGSTQLAKPSHTFGGWCLNEQGEDPVYGPEDGQTHTYSITNNTTFYAKWIPETYTITYKPGYAGPADVTGTKIYGVDYTILGNQFDGEEGYTFTGWKDDNNTSYAPGDTYTTNAALTLTAQWTNNPVCTIDDYAYDFGNVGVNMSKSHTFTITTANLTEDLTLNISSDKYTLSTSTIDDEATSTELIITFTPTATGTVDANLTVSGSGFSNKLIGMMSGTGATPLTITFDEGSGSCETESMSGVEGSNITLPTASPSANCATGGWTFAGWTTEEVDEETTTIPDPLYAAGDSYEIGNDNATLYAVYQLEEDKSITSNNIFPSGVYNDATITWTLSSVVTILQEQNGAQSAPNSDYTTAPRWYKDNKITITPSSRINYITVSANTESYATTLAGSTYTNASASADGTVVTITPVNGNNNITIVMANQSRLSSLVVDYNSSITTYYSNPSCTPTYTVTYHRNYTVSDETITTVRYDEGDDVTVAAANTFVAPTGKFFNTWNTQADGQGDDYDPADVIEDISADIDLYAKWRNIVYHITYNVNGEESTPVDVNYGQSITTLPTASLSPLTFLGWSTTGATGPVNVNAPYTPTGTTEDITLYAVFGSTEEATLTIDQDNSGLTTTYYTGDKIIESKTFHFTHLCAQNPNSNKVIQFRAPSYYGNMYNTTDFGVIRSVKITYYSESAEKALVVYAGDSENPNSATDVSSSGLSNNVETFTISGNHKYICIYNNNGTERVSSIEINYEVQSAVTVSKITDEQDMASIPANTSILVKNGGILTFTGTNSNPQNLIVEDGGQLIIPSAKTGEGVKATFQKEITAYTEEDGKDNYYLIANPTTDAINPATVAGMVEDDVDDEDDFDYDLYYFDEAQPKAEWRNYRQVEFNLVNGKGYLYAKSSDITLEFPGTVPPGTTADITLSKSGSGKYAGFNLVGNPLSNNITSMMFTEPDDCSYYKINSSSGVFEVPDSDEDIIVGEAFMVEAPSNGAVLKLNQGAKGEEGFNNDVIRLEVSNSKFTDVAYVYFGYHLPLTKINHLNDEAPMLYIHNENSDRAVEVYNNRGEVKSINVNFEAKTMGTYTISAKMVKGEIKYMHLYDRLTGIDTDLLVDDYSFIGTKDDQPGRFILNLESVDDNGSSTGSETFAYQSGDNIIVNGEGELQVFDVTGRMVMSQRVNGAQTVNGLNTGVYVFILDEKAQKVVIR